MKSTDEATLVSPDYLKVVTAHFLQSFSFASMILLPVYVTWLSGSQAQIGLVMATASAGSLIARPFVGWSLDRIGRKQTLYFGSLFVVVGLLSLYFVRSLGVALYSARFLLGLGLGTVFPGYFALVADIIPAARRTQGLALFGISGIVPLAFNAFIDTVGFESQDLRWVFIIAGVVSALSLWPLALVREAKPIQKFHRANHRPYSTRLRNDPSWRFGWPSCRCPQWSPN